ncbi:dihydrofolate reductase family protein [Amycolatopsis taiwanensis]|uniref:dihydrofolate reductase family protein n=1 Tax=Amycolatopsis taiwanensis TaxID=342230 RepID=UPI00048560CC|nr:dihydrofolate reductase family protein [Amycolatopsis taiwanensis]
MIETTSGSGPRLLYSATMSLDGFIAGPGGDQSWMTRYLGPNPVADELVDDIGALLVGARTFTGDDPNRGTDKEGAFSGQWHGPQIVLTHRPPADPPEGVRFIDDLAEAVSAAKSAAGTKKYVNVLGASIGRQCLEAGLLDEILVLIAPVLLGDGVRLFDHPGGNTVALERIAVSHAPLATNVWYRVER